MSENQSMGDYILVYPDYSMWEYEEDICRQILQQYGEIAENSFLAENGVGLSGEIPRYNLETLPFFQKVKDQETEETIIPRGHQYEKTEVPENTRKSARYLGHGIHEYTGKFYPQLVSSIFSLLDLDRGDTVMDPFCGSGTTLYQGRLESLNTVGIDINPFSIYLSRAKIGTFEVDADALREFTPAPVTLT
ncbi:MAG: DNA methyltransferase, partial [Halobacteriaceae archaeon]